MFYTHARSPAHRRALDTQIPTHERARMGKVGRRRQTGGLPYDSNSDLFLV